MDDYVGAPWRTSFFWQSRSFGYYFVAWDNKKTGDTTQDIVDALPPCEALNNGWGGGSLCL
jgi:hypothetical protein